ncbi:hypothetical protein ACLKA7_017683 [Drosophila subpalustris]
MAEVCITGAMRTTPSEALDAILHFPSIRQVSAEMATLSAIRLRDLDYWNDHLKGHSSILPKNNSIPTKTDYCMPIEHTKTPFHILIPSREEWAIEPPGKPGALSFYTDGSKLNNQNSHVTSGTISIYSDSQAAIRSIAATSTKSTSLSKCRKSLHEMAEHFEICLIWVPGHQGISGNCIADELARQGTTEILLPDKEHTIWWVAWPDKRGHTLTKPEPLPCVTSAEMNALSSSDPSPVIG